MDESKPTNHLAVYRRIKEKNYIDWMLKGSKTVDIKFSHNRIAPYGYIKPGDFMYIKEAGGPVVGRCTLGSVQFIDTDSNKFQMLDILMEVWEGLGLRDEEHAQRTFEKMREKRYMSIFTMQDQIELPRPIRIEKFDRRVWVANYQLPIDLKLAFGIPITEVDISRELRSEVIAENEGEDVNDEADSEVKFR